MSDKISTSKFLNAPIQKVWDAITQADQIAQWYGPEGITCDSITVSELAVDGYWRYCMKMGEGREFWGKGTFTAIEEPHYLAYLDTITDPEGNPIPMPTPDGGTEIKNVLVEYKLTEQDGGTLLEFISDSHGSEQANTGAMRGWNGAINKLETYLG